MRSRTIKEGSLGLFIFAGLSILGVVFIWLSGATFGKKTYLITVQFDNANGMQEGAIVRYRGLEVGRITSVEPASNGVNIQIEIQSPDLVMPKNVLIEANQGGLVGETSLEITPKAELSQAAIAQSPFAPDCREKGEIICNKDQLKGEIGVSFDSLLRSTVAFSDLYSDPAFFEALNKLTQNSSNAAAQITKLTQELTLLSKEVRGEVGNFSENADSITNAAISGSQQLTQTMVKVNELTGNLNSLVMENRQALVTTLNSITRTSDQMQQIIVSLDTTLDTVNQGLTATNTDELIGNLKTLTANAATASENLKDISSTLNDPANLTMLQKTLDAARVTFENTQKITSDLDELTGDPEFRKNLIDLVNGMSQLVSSAEQLQQQVQVANQIEPLRDEWSDLNISARPKVKGAPQTN